MAGYHTNSVQPKKMEIVKYREMPDSMVGEYRAAKPFRDHTGRLFNRAEHTFRLEQDGIIRAGENVYKLVYEKNIIKRGPVPTILLVSESELTKFFEKIL